MGTYYRAYIGPFLRMPITNQPRTKKILVDKNGKETSNKFDPKTGEENKFVTKQFNEEIIPDPYIEDDSLGLDEDMFTCQSYHPKKEILFWLNSNDFNQLKNEDTVWDYNKSLLHINPQTEIMRFKVKYAKYLDYYSKEYGKFEIDYGIIRDGS